MSLGGFRDPRDPDRDAFSPLEAQAIGWAHGKGAVVVAAVGNNTDTPPRPWPYASYPAALPHVLGVSALARDGSVPVFSHRDKIYTDIAAPGVGILSTFPRARTAETKECPEQGYSSCAPDDFRKGQGTSFAAPQVSAAAAVLLAVRPKLRPEQVTELLTRTAHDVNGATGCPGCGMQRDALTGWGRLDVNAALKQLLSAGPPPPDRLEPNDDAGDDAAAIWGRRNRIQATLDFWDDQNDVYAIRLRKRQLVFVSVRGPAGTDTNVILWHPKTKHVDDLASLNLVARQSARPGPREHLVVPRAEGRDVLPPGEARLPRRRQVPARARQEVSSSSSGTSRSTRAGLPTTSFRGGTSFVTTAPAPTNASSPISIPGQRIAPPPTRAPRRIVGPFTSARRFSVLPM